jgi:predicted Zn-dependent protease
MTDRWSSILIARCPDELADAVEQVAHSRYSKASDYIRQAAVAALRADGVDLAGVDAPSSNDSGQAS